MNGLLELIVEALYNNFAGIIHLFGCFVVDEKLATLLGGCIGGYIIKVFAQINGLLEGFTGVL